MSMSVSGGGGRGGGRRGRRGGGNAAMSDINDGHYPTRTELHAQIDAQAKENASLREQVARLSAPAVGLAESGSYTLADVALIEASRGRPYGRLRETIVIDC